MKKVILDENLPVSLRRHLVGFDAITVRYQGWCGVKNGELIRLVDGVFDVLLTADKGLRYQQNLKGRKIAILELPSNEIDDILVIIEPILAALHSISSGEYREIPPPLP